MIIGGAVDSVAIIPEATELYFRLPRLAEFYYSLFDWDDTRAKNDRLITMIPDLDGIFANLIRFVFIRASGSATGNYTDYELRELIGIINEIFSTYNSKNSERCIQSALNGFVAEINRRYGIVRKTEYMQFKTLIEETSNPVTDSTESDTNYSILPEEDTPAMSSRRAPSDRLLAGTFQQPISRTFTSLNNLSNEDRTLLEEFRAKIDSKIGTSLTSKSKSVSYALYLKHAETEIRKANTFDQKFSVVSRIIQSGSVVGSDLNKLVMFHETVVLGLNTLSALTTILDQLHMYAVRHNVQAAVDAIVDNVMSDSFKLGNIWDWSDAANVIDKTVTDNPSAEPATVTAAIKVAQKGKDIKNNQMTYDQAVAYARTNAPFVTIRQADQIEACIDGCRPDNKLVALVNMAFHAVTHLGFRWRKDHSMPDDADVKAQDPDVINAREFAKFIAFLMIDFPAEMRMLVENLFAAGSLTSGLINVQFVQTPSGKTLRVSFDGIRDLAEQLLADTKQYFELLRPYISKEIADIYEARTTAGSIYWIEEHLIDKFFRKKAGTVKSELAIDTISSNITKSFGALTQKNKMISSAMMDNTDVVELGKLDSRSKYWSTASSPNANLTAAIGDGTWATIDVVCNKAIDHCDKESTRGQMYGPTFSGLVYYDNTLINCGVRLTAQRVFLSNGIEDLVRRSKKSQLNADESRPHVFGKNDLCSFNLGIIDFTNTLDVTHRSLLFALNDMIAKYLTTFTDTAGGTRIYLNLINSYANGIASTSVMDPNGSAYPDLLGNNEASTAADGVQFGLRGAPKPTAILMQSLAFIIQRMLRDVGVANQVPDFLVTTLTDVPMYIKESMRANLPLFVNYFNTLVEKAEFIKQLIQKTDIDLTHPQIVSSDGRISKNVALTSAVADLPNYVGTQNKNSEQLEPLPEKRVESFTKRGELVSILDAIANHAFSLMTSAGECYKELGDSPVYFQTGEGSIEQYKSRYGVTPLMPLSLTSWFMRNLAVQNTGDGVVGDERTPKRISNGFGDVANKNQLEMRKGRMTSNRMLPGHAGSSPAFKMLYGSRGLLANRSSISFDAIPGAKAVLDMYNGTVSVKEQIDDSKYLSFCTLIIQALRFMTNARNIKAIFANDAVAVAANYVNDTSIRVESVSGGLASNCTYALSTKDNDDTSARKVMSVIENSSQQDELESIAKQVDVASTGSNNSREQELANNIIDMNIIPINVHALLRDIPLANLYNYSYTFEKMVVSLLGDGQNSATHQVFIDLLKNPYTPVTEKQYGASNRADMSDAPIQRIFRGDNALGMGRPKFLSDQIYNKCLFGSVYPHSAGPDEAGPNISIGNYRAPQPQIANIGLKLDELSKLDQVGVYKKIVAGFNPVADVIHLNGDTTKQKISSAIPATPTKQNAFQYLAFVVKLYKDAHVTSGSARTTNDATLRALFNVGDRRDALNAAFDAIIADADTLVKMPGRNTLLQNYLGMTDNTYGTINADANAKKKLPAWSLFVDDAENADSASKSANATVVELSTDIAAYSARPSPQNLVALCKSAKAITAKWVSGTPFPADINRPDALGAFIDIFDAAANMYKLVANLPGQLRKLSLAGGTMSTDTSDILTYAELDTDGKTVIKEVTVSPKDGVLDLAAQGRIRFDTKFIRNIFFITNVLRVIRLKLNRELTQSRNLLLSSHAAVAPGLTEYGFDPFTPNQITHSRTVQSDAQFSSDDVLI